MSRFSSFWRNLLRRAQLERELDEELQSALDLAADEKIRSGTRPDQARRDARLELGSLPALKDQVRDARSGVAVIDTLAQDLRYAVRSLRKNPTFSLVAIISLALGTGANAAIFQLINALSLRPLPVEKPHELVSLGIDQHGKGQVGRRYQGRSVFSEPLWQEIRLQQQALSPLFAWGSGKWDLARAGEVVWAEGFYVSGRFFESLRVQPHLGRLFTESDDQKGCGSPVAVLSYDFWRTRYGGNDAVGQTLWLDRRPFQVVGVAQAGFFGVEVGRSFDVAVPLCAEAIVRGPEAGTGRRDAWWLDIMGRLPPGSAVARVGAHVAAISPGIFAATVSPTYKPDWARNYTAFTLTAAPAASGVSILPPPAYAALWVLLGATGFVLLLTCANLANLMLARSTARGPEIAVRLAIGASRARLVAQLLSESAVIAALGALSGLLLARWISRSLLLFLNSGNLPVTVFLNLTPDWRVFALTSAVAVLVCLLSGLSPALTATRRDPITAMQPGIRSTPDGHGAALRRGLVVVQVALSIVLVVGALLFGRTLRNLSSVDPGFDTDVLVASVDLGRTAVRPAGRMQAFEDIAERLRTVSGVRYAAQTMIVPLSGADWNGQILKGGVVQEGDVHFNAVGGDYFRVMDTPILRGRSFDGRERPGSPRAAIVSETFARRFFPNGDAIGQVFEVDPTGTYSIVGLAKDAKFTQLGEERTAARSRFSADESSASFLPMAYLAVAQEMIPAPSEMRIVIRADRSPTSIQSALTSAITDTTPGAAVSYERVAAYIDTLLLPQRLVAWLSAFFGILALLIAAIGLYGVMSYLVTRRTVEIGVRIALGAAPRSVVRMMLAESGRLLAVGLVVGLALAAAASRAATSLLYGLTPVDPVSFALGIGLLGSVALFAAWLPAQRASKVAPAFTLRD